MTYIVVGAGILGASTAYRLAKAGEKVIVIDREEPGQATNAAAGIVCPWISQRRNKKWYTLAKNGAKYYPSLIEELKEDGEKDTGYQQVGALSIHTDVKKLEQMEQRAMKRREDAPEMGEITRLSAEDTRKLFPALAEDYEAVHVSGAARVNGGALQKALLHASVKYGAEVIHGNAALEFHNHHVTGVKVDGNILNADKVIVTAGAWASELLRPLGLDFQVSAQKAQIVHLQLPEADTSSWPVVMPPTDKYLLAFDDGKIIAGATSENDMGFDRRVTPGGLHEIFNKILTIAPGLSEATLVDTKVGFRPFTPGFLPVFGYVPGYEGILVANGLGSSGLTVGPYLGAELAKLAMGKETEIDPQVYDVREAIEIIDN
ncbi:NAD(P)/FAD-dependent oxidoreductase [Thalassobacillus hwangdonensis]|uniref:NAD(P)/FAD-dependent oxidoreductase n=1 Tax=Thalassobacillus hwangdonensis TaxID=546108 RepID=A0ABW3KZR1_9BACI